MAEAESNGVTGNGGLPEQTQAQLDRLARPSPRRIDPAQLIAATPPAEKDVKPGTAKPDDGGFMKQLGDRFFRRNEQTASATPPDAKRSDESAVETARKPKLADDKCELADDIENRVKARYTVVATNQGKKVELYEQGIDKPAISLDAKSISTTADRGAVVQDVVTLARDRGWQTLKVSGSATFKDEVWLEASKQGIKAAHEPSPRMQAEFDKWKQLQPGNTVADARPDAPGAPLRKEDLGQLFTRLSPQERLADPRFQNAQLELAVTNRVAERETGNRLAQMPEVERALVGLIAAQLSNGKVFDTPHVKPAELAQPAPAQRNAQAATPAVEEQAPLRQRA